MTDDHGVTELRLVLTVHVHARALALYRDTLGLEQLESYEERGGTVTSLSAGRATLEINDDPYAGIVDEVEVGHRVAGRIRVAFQVTDAQDATDRLVSAGATLGRTGAHTVGIPHRTTARPGGPPADAVHRARDPDGPVTVWPAGSEPVPACRWRPGGA